MDIIMLNIYCLHADTDTHTHNIFYIYYCFLLILLPGNCSVIIQYLIKTGILEIIQQSI